MDITGMKSGRLTVIKRTADHVSPCSHKETRWDCICECGATTNIVSSRIITGRTKSCGCFQIDRVRESNTKHGHKSGGVETSEYRAWVSMKDRCSNPNNPAFKNYGERGIVVCESWVNSFNNFISDMGHKPYGMTLERINNNDGYSHGNCKWATYYEQGKNKRNNVFITFDGVTLTISEWARKTGISKSAIRHRINRGWSKNRALTEGLNANHK